MVAPAVGSEEGGVHWETPVRELNQYSHLCFSENLFVHSGGSCEATGGGEGRREGIVIGEAGVVVVRGEVTGEAVEVVSAASAFDGDIHGTVKAIPDPPKGLANTGDWFDPAEKDEVTTGRALSGPVAPPPPPAVLGTRGGPRVVAVGGLVPLSLSFGIVFISDARRREGLVCSLRSSCSPDSTMGEEGIAKAMKASLVFDSLLWSGEGRLKMSSVTATPSRYSNAEGRGGSSTKEGLEEGFSLLPTLLLDLYGLPKFTASFLSER
jgi:hypothetical protein